MKLNPSNTAIIKRLLVGRNNRPLRSILNKLEPGPIASLFSSLNQREIELLVDALISIDKIVEPLSELPESQLMELLPRLPARQLTKILVYANEDDAAYFLGLLESEQQKTLLEAMQEPKRQKIQQFLSYPEGSAGRMMESQVFCVSSKMTASEGLSYLRKRAQEESIYYIYCIDGEGRLVGTLSLRRLATAPPETQLFNLMKKEVITVTPETSSEKVARLVAQYDFIALPVVDNEMKLLGVITVDDVVDIIQEQATADLYARVGLQEDDRVFAPSWKKIKNRMPWMFLNLFLAALASSVVSLFEETMSHLIILASLKNIVASMGGNTAIQSLTVVTRGLATGDFNFISQTKAIAKEAFVGTTIALFTGLGAGLLTFVWKGNLMVAVVIGLSMVLNAIVASFAGSFVPILLQKLHKDPAAGSGVLVTMVTDIFGFLSFLGIATIGLQLLT